MAKFRTLVTIVCSCVPIVCVGAYPQSPTESSASRQSVLASAPILDVGFKQEDMAKQITSLDVRFSKPGKTRFRGGGILGGGDSEEHEDSTNVLECGVTMKATAQSDKDDACPDECPYFAQDLEDDETCTFICVAAEQCAVQNPNRPIAAEIETIYGDVRKICRSPMVQHCEEYDYSGADRCKVCQALYTLGEDGQCWYRFGIVLWFLTVVLIVLVVVIIVWVVDLNCRPETSAGTLALDHGLANRGLQMIHHPSHEGVEGERRPWPLMTNMCTTDVCGAGMMLHFNFQAVVIIWALLIAFCWCSLIWFVDPALAVIGTKRFGTPRQNCILVAWGYETQQRLMWTKELFLLVVYLITFIGALLHGVRQQRIFNHVDETEKTMQDYALLVRGLPKIQSTDTSEGDLKYSFKDAVEEALGKKGNDEIVGVSICWDYGDQVEAVDQSIRSFMTDVDETQRDKQADIPGMNPLRKGLFTMEHSFFIEDEPDPIDIKNILLGLKSSGCAIVVFTSEGARDEAYKAQKNAADGFKVLGSNVELERMKCEPQNVFWYNFGKSTGGKVFRTFLGFWKICVALLFWGLFFYAPYAWSIFTWNYDNGQQPPFSYGFAFSMIVCIGNVIMYATCDSISLDIGFLFKDDKETCYMLLYTIACTLNILLDLVTTYYTSLYIMEGLDFRTYDGTHLEQVTTFTERFESYAIQRSLAESVYAYAYPSTYLIPFLLEPIMTIWLPLQIGKLIIRNHPEILLSTAEDSVAAAPMELGRYADILLNMILGILIFYFPGGYTHTLFFAMAACHVYIYAFDHWKVLRGIPQCTFANFDVDWWSQVMIGACCSLILACNVFKSNCQERGFCLDGWELFLACCAAFAAHLAAHTLLLSFVVPRIAGRKHERVDELKHVSYAHMNSEEACSWFNSNPIHCLRSKHIYEHNPPCVPFVPGKEHLMRVNEQIGCYFHDKKALKASDFHTATTLGSVGKRASSFFGFGSAASSTPSTPATAK